MVGYTRQDTSNNISNGSVIDADDLDAEFDALALAFNGSTGHAHDGTSGNGPPISSVGPSQEITVSSSAVLPSSDDAIDLGSSVLEFKDLYLDGTANIDTLAADAGTVGGANIVTVSATQTLTNKTLDAPVISNLATLTTSGNVSVGGTLSVTGTSTLGGNTAVTGNITVTGTVDGRDLAADGTKLDGIESNATADQTGAEIKSLYEAESDTNVFTDAEKSKLSDIDQGVATTDSPSFAGLTVDTNTIYVDSTNNRVGITTSSPATTLHVAGDTTFGGAIDETVYALSGTSAALDPSNGTIQTHTLTGNTTYSDSISAGESVTLMIDDGSAYTVTWPTMTWVNNNGSAPTLAETGYTVVALWKVSTTLYGALVGSGS